MARPTLGHLKVQIVERKPLIGARYWFWRTRYVDNGKIGVRSETYNSLVDCTRSIKAHRLYLGAAPVYLSRPDGSWEQVDVG